MIIGRLNLGMAMNKKIIYVLLLCFVTIFINACSEDKSKELQKPTTLEVKPTSLHKKLFFTGVIQPIRESSLTNPANASIEILKYRYGQKVQKGDLVMTLSSPDLQRQYNDTLTEYLKAKDAFSIAQAKFVGTQDLWESGLISKNNYLSEKSNLNTARITLVQARKKLAVMLERLGDGAYQNLSSLSLNEFDKVRAVLSGKHNMIRIKAPISGVLLYPPSTNNDDKSNRLNLGSSVKEGQVLGLIGDLSGIRVEIDVPEVDIDKIKPGMDAYIKSVAYPKDILHGKISSINAQASNTSGSLPSFTATVEVTKLSNAQQNWLRVGMSANIEIPVNTDKKIIIPIKAITHKNGASIVKKIIKSGEVKEQTVLTGEAGTNTVAIESGLKPGDKIVYG